MALKKIGIICSLTLLTLSKAFPQHCNSLDRYIEYKSRKYYLDSGDNKTQLVTSEMLKKMRSTDTSLVKEIFRKGTENEDYVSFFQQKGISIKAISFDQFVDLPNDTVLLTKREMRLKKKYDTLWERENALLIAEKYDNSLSKKINKKKFEKLHEKLLTQNPYLFIMYPIFKYSNYILVMFEVITCRRCERVFNYDLCNVTSK